MMQKFSRLLLGLLFVLCSLKGHPLAHANQDWKMKKHLLVVAAQKEIQNRFIKAEPKNTGHGSWKMVVHEVFKREIVEKSEGLHEAASDDISDWLGKKEKSKATLATCYFNAEAKQNTNATENAYGTSQDQVNDQGNMKIFGRKTLKSSNLGTSSGCTSTDNPVDHPYKNFKQFQDSKQLAEGVTQGHLEATREIVNLIHKDYQGMDKPRRKPPINNRVPIH